MRFQITTPFFTINVILFAFLIASLLLLTACGGGGGGGDAGGNIGQVGTSSHNATRSHNAGADCSDCHYSGGTGQGVFTVAGTVFTSGSGNTVAPNGMVKIYADQTRNTLVATLEVDAKGNFYTVDPIDGLTDTGSGIAGVYVTVGNHNMGGTVSTYANGCNTCHGPATATTFGGQQRIY